MTEADLLQRFDAAAPLYPVFARIAAARGDAPALLTAGGPVSYADLAARAEAAAGWLLDQGVTRGAFVGFLGGRSVEAIVAMLACFRAGAACVPLDPTHAPEQLSFIAGDCGLAACFLSTTHADLAGETLAADTPHIALTEAAGLPRTARDWPEGHGDDVAYLLYTSGTTGAPKGVLTPQRAVTALVLDQTLTQVRADDVILHASTIACDGAIYDIWGGLLTGAQVAVVEAAFPSLDDVAAVMKRDHVTVAGWYAGVHHLMIEHHVDAFATMRLSIAGGDVMSPPHAAKLVKAWPQITLCNVFGPTECTTDSLGLKVTPELAAAGPLPIGTPLAQTSAFVVDPEGAPLPAGEVGELVIGGAGVALGYHGRPDKTAEVFIADPRPGHDGIVYRTGDLAMERADGVFEFHGRADRQVKLAGRRIELDGVEHEIRTAPGVADAIVDVTGSGEAKQMVAFLRPEAPVTDAAAFTRAVLAHAAQSLPETTLPRTLHLRDSFPLTPAGKVDRRALRESLPKAAAPAPHAKAQGIRAIVGAVWDEILHCGPVADDVTFFEAGGTSMDLIRAHAALEKRLETKFSITLLFEVPRFGALCERLAKAAPEVSGPLRARVKANEPIAIIGMSGRFPGSKDIAAFWEHLKAGDNLIPQFSPEEIEDDYSPAERAMAAYVAARPWLPDVDLFDAKYFNMLPREAKVTDPQGRIFLEVCHEALEQAALDPTRYRGAVGVYAGSTQSTYLLNNVLQSRAELDRFLTGFQVDDYTQLTGNDTDSMATRIAYRLGLTGPALSVNTACSTSLVAIGQAVAALRGGQTDVALAGGVSITFPQKRGYMAIEGGMAAPDGVCRPFDAEGAGTVFGHGAGVIVLKRLSDAEADGDNILALIKGVGLNNDGADKISYTAPSVTGQAMAIRMAHQDAEVEPGSVSFVECHGTATPLGDPIEIEGLTQAFAGSSTPCALGAVKGNIGHMDAAAGIMGVIKTVLALQHRQIPPVANYRAPNPRIDFSQGPFFVADHLIDWESDGPRRAGVSSFGVGGTNAHILMEEAPAPAVQTPAMDRPQVLPLSAKSPEALSQMAAELASALEADDAPALSAAAFTLQEGRRAHPLRLTVAASTNAEAAAALRAAPSPRKPAPQQAPQLVWMFPGQGSQFPGMGRGLYESEPVFRDTIDEGAALLEPLLGLDINQLLCFGEVSDAEAARALRDTRLTQPALYLTQVANARLWLSRGITPDRMIGHSVGEFVAATVAGVMSFADGLRIIAERGRLMQDLPGGAMLGVKAKAEDIAPFLSDSVQHAARNAPGLQVLAGPFDAIEAVEAQLTQAGLAFSRLHTSHAFHSAMMDPVVAPLHETVAKMTLAAPQIPVTSSVTGEELGAQATDPGYWAAQARACVDFRAALSAAAEGAVLMEMGAGTTLCAFARQTLGRDHGATPVQTLPDHSRAGEDALVSAQAAGQLWSLGLPLDWAKLGPRDARRVPLPTYAFQRRSYWIERKAQDAAPVQAAAAAPPDPTLTAPPPVAAPQFQEQSIETTVASEPQMSAPRTDRLTTELIALFSTLSGEDYTPEDAGVPFLELGLDSLFMGQLSQGLAKEYGVEIGFRELMANWPTMEALAAHLDEMLPPEAAPAAASAPAAPMAASPAPVAAAPAATPVTAPAAAPAMPAAAGDMAALMQSQMATMQAIFAEQMRALGGAPAVAAPQAAIPAPVAAPAPAPVAAPAPAAAAPAATPAEKPAKKEFKTGRGASVTGGEFDESQLAFVKDLCARYTDKHPKSKAYTQQYRKPLADPRTAAAFRPEWKELTFPIVAEISKGAHITDIDGNDYVDVVNGFGQTAFGHSPDFVVDAVNRQMERGFPIGPQADEAGPLAARLSQWLGHDRITFCNTGSEAVMAAMRVARTVTGREKIVVFGNDYHGQFDEVLIKGKARSGGEPTALPIAPGIPRSGLANMVVVNYGGQDSLDWITNNIKDIAAVIVEPVQSRHPEHRPEDFVRELRRITADGGAALVIDEVVTGFRTSKTGQQGVWGIKPDMATYGKVLGGGMPIGLLAGSSKFMDALDGGDWQFGDDSQPEAIPTFFAGTFVRHPLILAALTATLDHMETPEGAALWTDVADRCRDLGDRMKQAMTDRGLPVLVEQYSSWFVIKVTEEDPRASLLYPLMRMEGVHIMDGFCGFLTTTHSAADIERIYTAFCSALDTLLENGILVHLRAPDWQPKLTGDQLKGIPLTEGQSEIWMTHQMGGKAAASFNESASLFMEGPLNQSALEAALSDLVARHDALRARFARSGMSFDILDAAPVTLDLIDLSGEADPDAAYREALAADVAEPFTLTDADPLRLSLFRLGTDKHVLIFTAHHIIADGWSFGVLFDDLNALYTAHAEGTSANLPTAPSFAAHARKEAGKQPAGETLAYWRETFADVPALPDLPTDRPRGERRVHDGATATAFVPLDVAKSVRKAGAKQGCTLFATLFGALQMMVGRMAGTSDVVLGVPTGGQALLANQSLVGHCVNFLPVRAAFDMQAPVADHLKALSGKLLEAFDHQEITYGTLVRALEVPRTLNRLPLTEIEFNVERYSDEGGMAGLTTHVEPNPKAAVNFDLFFNVCEVSEGLRLDLHYNSHLFDAETADRLLARFRGVMEAIAADTAQPVAALPVQDAEEAAKAAAISDALNATHRAYDLTQTLPALTRATAATHAGNVAVECGDSRLTHAELDAKSDALAALIQSRLGAQKTRVGVALPRSTDMLVALLAVQKAGHAYVPLDPRQPAARLRSILETAQAAAVVTLDAAPEYAEGLGLPLISPAEATAGAKPTPVALEAEDAAYVIFTSGSTGTPKGVAIPHRAVVNFLHSMADAPGFSAEDTILSVTTVMFDIAVLELYLPLITGGKTVIATTEEVIEGFPLVKRMAQGDITVMQATPTLWDMLLDAGLKPAAGLKILAGGEPLPQDLADKLRAEGATLWNMYGPTETTIWSTVKQIDGIVSAGHPIANTTLHILDEQDRPLPVGTVGELNIGGAGLALGYYNRPDLTEAAFRPVTIDGTAQRLYRTGDLAKITAAGEVEILGRIDTQVKLRGFRIELGEIETRLRACEGVDKAAVALKARPNGDKQLVAYIVPSGAAPEAAALSTTLADTLPDYMVPRAYVTLDALPQTANGKLDRKALPEPVEAVQAAPAAAQAPATETESRLAKIWADVLGLESVGVTDTLYAMGADSLMVFRIAARMLDEGLNLEAKDMLAHPTIRELAAFADSRGDAEAPKRPSLRDFRKGARRNEVKAS